MQHLLLCFEKIKARQFSSTDPWFRIEAPITTSDLRSWPFLFFFWSTDFFLQKPFIFYWHEWVFSHFSHVQLFVTLWTDCQAPLFMAFSRQEYWSGLPFPSPGDLPDPGIEHVSYIAGRFFTNEPPGKSFISEYSWLIMWQFQLSHTHTCIHSLPNSPAIQAEGAGLLKH